MTSRALRQGATAVGLGVVYFLVARVGLTLAIPPGNATAFWPPSGIAMAAVLLLGWRVSPGIWLGAFAATLTTGAPPAVAAVVALGNTVEAVGGAFLISRMAGGGPIFRSAERAVVFVAASAVSCAVAATVGLTALQAGGLLGPGELLANWVTWWLGDLAGVVVLVPLVVAFAEPSKGRAAGLQVAQAWPLLLTLAVASFAVFGGWLPHELAALFLYLPVVLLVWIAVRLEFRVVTVATAVLASIALLGASQEAGVFAAATVQETLLHLQAFVILFGGTGLALAALVTSRRESEVALQNAQASLERVVLERTRTLEETNRSLASEMERRRAAESAERLRRGVALDAIGEGIVITDPDARIQYVNPAFERITGYEPEDVVGENPRVLQSGQHDRSFYSDMWSTITAGKVWRGSFVDRRKDGTLYHTDSTIAPIHGPGGEKLGFVAVSRDVTELRQSEAALRESEARVRAILETAADGIITMDGSGTIESCNPSAGEIFGFPTRELIGEPVSRLVPSELQAKLDKLLNQGLSDGSSKGKGKVREVRGIRQDGSDFPMDLAISEVELGDRRLFTGIVRDVTERHVRVEAEKALTAVERELEVARSIQEGLFPAGPPAIEGFDIAAFSRPAVQTGGDYYDFLPMPGGTTGFVVADVRGHGVGPALLMSETRAYLRALVQRLSDVGEIVSELNSFLFLDGGNERFTTLFLAQLDPRRKSIVHASAGHLGHIVRANGAVEQLPATGIPLGIMDRRVSTSLPAVLGPGDLLLLMTDGIEEACSPDEVEFGRERALEVVKMNLHRSAEEIVEALCECARRHSQHLPQADDVTVVAVKRL